MKYKIGDAVRIKNDIQPGETYGRCGVLENMLKFRGTMDTIDHMDRDGDYYLTDKDNYFVWHEDMLEPVETKDDLEESIREDDVEYKVGDVVRIKNNLQVGEKYGLCKVTKNMLDYRGTLQTIKYIDPDGDLCLGDNTPCVWDKGMVELVKAKDELEEPIHVNETKEVDDMEYKVGDVVRIKESIQENEEYGTCDVIDEMLKYRGTIHAIEYIDEDGDFYLTDVKNSYGDSYVWHKNMVDFIGISQPITPKTSRQTIYDYLLNNLAEMYEDTNNNQDDAIINIYDKFGDISFLVHILEQYNKISRLRDPNDPRELDDNKINDAILDLANYCLLWLTEREYRNQ